MFCAKCGAVLDDKAKKCDKCGAPVRIRPNQAAGTAKGAKKVNKASSVSGRTGMPAGEDLENSLPEETFMDPVFYKEAGNNVDVDAIIKIARGEDPEKPAETEKADAPVKAVEMKKAEKAEAPVKAAETKKAEKAEAPAKAAETKKAEKAEMLSEEVPEPELDMNTYLASLPLIEKIRRSLSASHHRREEEADRKRMSRQLEKASKHFADQETDKQKAEEIRQEAARRKEEERQEAARRKEEERREAARRQEEKVRAEKARAETAKKAGEAAKKAEEEAAKNVVTEAASEKQKAVSAEKTDAATAENSKAAETSSLQEEKALDAQVSERAAKAARQRERARSAAAKRQEQDRTEELAQEPEGREEHHAEIIRLQGREGRGVIRVQGADNADDVRREKEERAVQAARQEEILRAAEQAEEDRRVEETAAALNAQADAAQKAGAETLQKADAGAVQREGAEAEQPAARHEEKVLAGKGMSYDAADYSMLVSSNARKYEDLTEEERKIEDARRLRRYRDNQPDRMDIFLGKYGLTKETAVRIGTLGLIVLLSAVYVLGRGSGSSSVEPSYAGEGMTGSTAAEQQAADEMPAQDAGETEVPTGGGDFQNN